MAGDLCLRRERSLAGLGACLRAEARGVSGASVTIRGKRVGAALRALERSLESRGLAPGTSARRAAPVPDCENSARIRCRPGQRLVETRSLQTPRAHRVLPAPNALPVLGGVAQLECLPRQTAPDTCLIQQGVDLLGGGEGTVSQQCPRHAAPKRADRRRTPTWCEIVSSLAAVAGVLISLIQLLRG